MCAINILTKWCSSPLFAICTSCYLPGKCQRFKLKPQTEIKKILRHRQKIKFEEDNRGFSNFPNFKRVEYVPAEYKPVKYEPPKSRPRMERTQGRSSSPEQKQQGKFKEIGSEDFRMENERKQREQREKMDMNMEFAMKRVEL